MIFIKMSNRKLGREDEGSFYRAADAIKSAVETVSAKLDPEGPALRQHHRDEIVGIYRAAGVEAIYMEPLPNGYCGKPCCLNRPWFRVTSSIGHVTIGWRKRVMSIDWRDTVLRERHADELFPDEDVTRVETTIHAWGADKAADYIRRLHAAAATKAAERR